jgi:hypothetical protein
MISRQALIATQIAKVNHSLSDICILISLMETVFRDAQTCITVKENTLSKIVAILRKIAESGRMLELSEILA